MIVYIGIEGNRKFSCSTYNSRHTPVYTSTNTPNFMALQLWICLLQRVDVRYTAVISIYTCTCTLHIYLKCKQISIHSKILSYTRIWACTSPCSCTSHFWQWKRKENSFYNSTAQGVTPKIFWMSAHACMQVIDSQFLNWLSFITFNNHMAYLTSNNLPRCSAAYSCIHWTTFGWIFGARTFFLRGGWNFFKDSRSQYTPFVSHSDTPTNMLHTYC